MRNRPAAVGIAVFLLLLSLGSGLVVQGARRAALEERQEAAVWAAAGVGALGAAVERLMGHARVLGAALEEGGAASDRLDGGPDGGGHNRDGRSISGEAAAGRGAAAVAAALRRSDPLLQVLAVAPAGGTARIYTGEETAAAALLRALAAPAPAEPVLLGPLTTATGRELLAAGVSMGEAEASRAYAAAFLDELLGAARFGELAAAGFDYRLTREVPGRRQLVARSSEAGLAAPVEESLDLSGGTWTLAVASRTPRVPASTLFTGGLLVVALAVGAALVAHDLARRPARLQSQVESQAERLSASGRRLVHEMELRQKVEEQLRHHSYHDVLTGLPNRGQLRTVLERALERCRRQPAYQLAVLVLDLDRFALVNDTFGHERGDDLLLAVAQRLEAAIRPQDALARLGADEFALLLFDIGSPLVARDVAARVHKALAEPFLLGSREIFVSASIGIALSASGYDRAEDLVRDADVALFQAKAEGGGRAAVFAPAMRHQVAAALELESDLRRAVEREELRLVYQPIVSLATGQVSGFEALVRWQHPLEGRLTPDRFLRLAEETGQVVAIDRWVLQRACDTARSWRRYLGERRPFAISVNLSGRNLGQPDLGDQLTSVVGDSGLPQGTIRLELTESEIIHNLAAASELLPQLRREGIPVALDDFGTGYSSLSYLHRFQFDLLKIDRSFISRLLEDQRDAGIVRAIVGLARTLGMQTVAEGVEESGQAEALRLLGCEYGQGFLYSRPVEEAEAMALLAEPPRAMTVV